MSYLIHYGTPRHSGRYPYGTGKKYEKNNNVVGFTKDFWDLSIEMAKEVLKDGPFKSARMFLNNLPTDIKNMKISSIKKVYNLPSEDPERKELMKSLIRLNMLSI